jgi:tRNA G18 (ribose-2'-O)-methylase SpoU
MSVEREKSPGVIFEERAVAHVGVGPHPEPWPDDPRLDRTLLAQGDRRNVIDRYRYWSVDAITKDLDERRFEFHVAIENWKHDLNIGTVVRNANAFMAARVHIVGAHRWNRRGAMCTDRYVHIEHHASVERFAEAMARHSPPLPIIGVDLLPGSVPIERVALPRACVLVFGQEGVGLSEAMRAHCSVVCAIRQFGSTRSINAGVASGIAMYQWILQHVSGATLAMAGGP